MFEASRQECRIKSEHIVPKDETRREHPSQTQYWCAALRSSRSSTFFIPHDLSFYFFLLLLVACPERKIRRESAFITVIFSKKFVHLELLCPSETLEGLVICSIPWPWIFVFILHSEQKRTIHFHFPRKADYQDSDSSVFPTFRVLLTKKLILCVIILNEIPDINIDRAVYQSNTNHSTK